MLKCIGSAREHRLQSAFRQLLALNTPGDAEYHTGATIGTFKCETISTVSTVTGNKKGEISTTNSLVTSKDTGIHRVILHIESWRKSRSHCLSYRRLAFALDQARARLEVPFCPWQA